MAPVVRQVRAALRRDDGALSAAAAPITATYVGEPACTKCHESQTAEWRQSDHARAMALAADDTVLGNFDNATFTYAGVTSSFSRRDGKLLA